MLRNVVYAQIVCADISRVLRELIHKNITVHNIKDCGDLSISCVIRTVDISAVEKILSRYGGAISIIRKGGISVIFMAALHRPVFVCSVIMLIFLSVFIPTRILFVEVEGNTEIPDQLIIQTAEACGIHFGTSRRMVNSEKTKNALLEALPELQWAGINTKGCVAIISVEEKRGVSIEDVPKGQVSNIVATRDGLITQCTVHSGNALCTVGQAVSAGQILVSGYTDCGIRIQATRADAEIFAETLRECNMILPSTYTVREDVIGQSQKISLQIGKKVINLSNGSGISGTTCVKMYSKKYITLPGGLRLPVALIIERFISYSTGCDSMDSEQGKGLLEISAENYLLSQMYSGRILHTDSVILYDTDYFVLTGEFLCNEMIGKVVYEESLYINGKNE